MMLSWEKYYLCWMIEDCFHIQTCPAEFEELEKAEHSLFSFRKTWNSNWNLYHSVCPCLVKEDLRSDVLGTNQIILIVIVYWIKLNWHKLKCLYGDFCMQSRSSTSNRELIKVFNKATKEMQVTPIAHLLPCSQGV